MNLRYFIILSSILTLAFIVPTRIMANSYFFQDEFNLERTPNTLEASKWNLYPNSNLETRIRESGGSVQLQSGISNIFPYVVSKTNPFPVSENFTLEFGIQYTSVVQRGNGFVVSLTPPANNIDELDKDNPEVYFFGVWQGTDNGFDITYDGYCAPRLPCSRPGVNIYNRPSPDLSYHTIKLIYSNSVYTVYLDGKKMFVSPPTTNRPRAIWFGNPTNQYSNASWTSFKIDYVRITTLPQPFLDLPWDYRSQGSTFSYMALNPYSWFDHQYPLQNQCCNWQVMTYAGETIQQPYRSHNGYDYSRKNGIVLNTPVLAAAAGTATFKPWGKSGGAGNVIKIDHGNGYQTWYEHLSKDGLIVSTEGQGVEVEQGEQIGLVGMTGNTNGPHIHFSVFKDSNNNDSFTDEIPYGVTDPLGWDGETDDPWPNWNNGIRSGTASYNLFSPASFTKSIDIPVGGGILSAEDTTISVPQGAYNKSFKLIRKIGPFVSLSDYTTGITPSFSLNAYSNNQPITEFLKPIKITINYSKANLTNIKENTIKFRYFNEQTQLWEELPTTRDITNKIISTEINHLSRFAVSGEVKDLISPTTKTIISGEKSQEDWYRTPVRIELQGQDNEGGVGLEYTLYTLNDNDWIEYNQPLLFEDEGDYQIIYQSYDKAENQEQRKALNFHIDKTPPQVSLDTSIHTLWPPNGKMVPVNIFGNSTDDNLHQTEIFVDDEYNQIEPTFIMTGSNFSQTIQLEAKRKGNDLDGRSYTIKATVTDLAGNLATASAQILVPHDQRR